MNFNLKFIIHILHTVISNLRKNRCLNKEIGETEDILITFQPKDNLTFPFMCFTYRKFKLDFNERKCKLTIT